MHHMDMPMGYHLRAAMLEYYQRHAKAGHFCRQYRMICFMSSLIRQLYHFVTDFDRMLL